MAVKFYGQFINDVVAVSSMVPNVLAGIDDKGHVRVACLAEGCRHAHDDHVGIRRSGEVRRCRQFPGFKPNPPLQKRAHP
jgi:hypothetical protein